MKTLIAICLLFFSTLSSAEIITLDIYSTYEGVETKAGHLEYDTELFIGDP